MSTEIVFANARIVTRDAVVEGSVQTRDGRIVAIDEGKSVPAGAIDLDGDYLLPGLIELHTDNLERHVTPRPGVRWPAEAAVLAHDGQIATSGITTVFDALSVGDVKDGSDRLANLTMMADAIGNARSAGLLRADHRLHMRCEISHRAVLDLFQPFADNPLVGLVSVMDHTPGQRQFVRVDKYREYYQGKYNMTNEQMEQFIIDRRADQMKYSVKHRAAVVEMCRERGLVLASHDDATADHVAEAKSDGVAVAEFPTTVEAAQACRAEGLSILAGAPNVVRGGSHSGNIAAASLARDGLLDILSSDYVPMSLVLGAFMLAEAAEIRLPDAVATVSANPAEAVGLNDRGRIEVGRRADLVRVAKPGAVPVVRAVWREGERVV